MSSFSRLEFSRAWNYCGCWLGEIMPFTSESKSPDLRGAQRVGCAFPEDTQGHISLRAHTAAKRWSTPPPMAPKKRRAADRSPTRIKLELTAADGNPIALQRVRQMFQNGDYGADLQLPVPNEATLLFLLGKVSQSADDGNRAAALLKTGQAREALRGSRTPPPPFVCMMSNMIMTQMMMVIK